MRHLLCDWIMLKVLFEEQLSFDTFCFLKFPKHNRLLYCKTDPFSLVEPGPAVLEAFNDNRKRTHFPRIIKRFSLNIAK